MNITEANVELVTDTMKEYAFQYPWSDGTYVIVIPADSMEEANERLQQAARHGHCFTPYGSQTMWARSRWMADLELWLTKLFRRGGGATPGK